MLRKINRVFLKHRCLFLQERCLVKRLSCTNKHRCLRKIWFISLSTFHCTRPKNAYSPPGSFQHCAAHCREKRSPAAQCNSTAYSFRPDSVQGPGCKLNNYRKGPWGESVATFQIPTPTFSFRQPCNDGSISIMFSHVENATFAILRSSIPFRWFHFRIVFTCW